TFLKTDRLLAERVGFVKPGEEMPAHIANPINWADITSTYRPRESAVIAQLASHVPPEKYRPLSTSTAMRDAMISLALDSKALAAYQQDHKRFTESIRGLTPAEKVALT